MKSPRLHLDALEVRDIPAIFGVPWANSDFLTVSFAPDGTKVDGIASSLYKVMANSGLSETVWKAEVLKAFQTWSAQTNVNVGVVADNGAAIGVSGNIQSDARFGDIRISAVPLSSDVFAITLPPGNESGTRAGDIVLNSKFLYGIGVGAKYDLYSVFLQETGHSLGIANSTDPASPMFEIYGGVRTGLTSGDVQSVQNLYGWRSYNLLEYFGNNSATSATKFSRPANVLDTTTLTTYADIGSSSDADWYKITAPNTLGLPLTIQLQTAGLSLLSGKLTVMDDKQFVIGTATARGSGQDLSVTIARPTAGASYYLRVEDADGTPFAVGAYRLRVVSSVLPLESVSVSGLSNINEFSLMPHSSIDTATKLTDDMNDGITRYATVGNLNDLLEKDYYKVHAPAAGLNQTNVLIASVRNLAGSIAPSISAFDSTGKSVAATAKSDGKSNFIVQIDGAQSDSDYYISVNARLGASLSDSYYLKVDFRSKVIVGPPLTSGTVNQAAPEVTGTLDIAQSQQIYFQLSAPSSNIVSSVTVRIYDSAGKIAFSLVARSGDSVSGTVLLNAGTYTVKFTSGIQLFPGDLDFSLFATVVSDPIGVRSEGPTSPPPPPPSYSSSSNSPAPPTSGNKV